MLVDDKLYLHKTWGDVKAKIVVPISLAKIHIFDFGGKLEMEVTFGGNTFRHATTIPTASAHSKSCAPVGGSSNRIARMCPFTIETPPTSRSSQPLRKFNDPALRQGREKR